MKNIILVICSVFCLMSCKKEDTQSAPIADFSFDKRNIGVGDTVIITNLTKNGYDKCYWTLPGSFNGVFDAPNKTYPIQYVKPGKFSVTLSVTNAAGSDEMTRPEYITVQDDRIKVSGSLKNDKNKDVSGTEIHITQTDPNVIFNVVPISESNVIGASYSALLFKHYKGLKVKVALWKKSSGGTYSTLATSGEVTLSENLVLDLTVN